MPHLTALATLLAVLFYALLSVPVSRARARSGVKAPTMVGDPALERAVRVQANTLEWMPIFLPALWLAALYVSDAGAAALGLVWIAVRALDARLSRSGGKARPRLRHPGRGGVGAVGRRGDRRAQGAASGGVIATGLFARHGGAFRTAALHRRARRPL